MLQWVIPDIKFTIQLQTETTKFMIYSAWLIADYFSFYEPLTEFRKHFRTFGEFHLRVIFTLSFDFHWHSEIMTQSFSVKIWKLSVELSIELSWQTVKLDI